MPFNTSPDLLALALAADLAGIRAAYIGASLLAAAAVCLETGCAEWGDSEVMPSEDVYRAVEPLSDNVDPLSPEAASWFLLFAREELRY